MLFRSPMTIRFFILQAHYRSTVDFSNDALLAAEKGLSRLLDAYSHLKKITPADSSSVNVKGLRAKCDDAICDDLNTPIVISLLFDAGKAINTVHDGNGTISAEDLEELKAVFKLFIEDILGLQADGGTATNSNEEVYKKAVDLLLQIRQQSKENKDWATSDKIRNEMAAFGFKVKDTKDGFDWSL